MVGSPIRAGTQSPRDVVTGSAPPTVEEAEIVAHQAGTTIEVGDFDEASDAGYESDGM